MPSESSFRFAVTSLWFRLVSLGIVGVVFAEALFLASGKIQGWSFYLSPLEVVFEVAVRVIFSALAGMVVGSICTAAIAPFLWHFNSSRERLAETVTKVAVAVVVFVDARLALTVLINWSYTWGKHRALFDIALLTAYSLAFVVALFRPGSRREVVSSLDPLLSKKVTRRAAIATVGGAAALMATEFAIGKTARSVKAALVPRRPNSNFLLITFDALSAEDMPLYGYGLPTTPNIDAFAEKGTIFTNFYSASTFTTPALATILTGCYPSESHVHQLQGRVRANDSAKTLAHLMGAAGYTTGAFISNPYAYYFARDLESEYDVLPDVIFQQGGLQHLWNATRPLHQNSGIGNRMDEYHDLEAAWNFFGRMDPNLCMQFRAAATFEQAREALVKLPDGFFMWIHVMTPHHPYFPDPADRGRFLPYAEQQGFEHESESRWRPSYTPDQQSQVDRRRLLYDEFILTADRAFGSFMAEMESGGKLRNTTVIVSADHGESFEGGVFRHQTPYLTRPIIHVPLIVRTPGQQESRRVAFTADQTALLPTILELAGQPKPDWMRGQSLASWLHRDGQANREGQAFTEYLEKNSAFKPLRHGTVGVIDGQSQYQYVLDLDTQKGLLRPLSEAQIWNLDRTRENPALADRLRAAIYSRFPNLVQKPT